MNRLPYNPELRQIPLTFTDCWKFNRDDYYGDYCNHDQNFCATNRKFGKCLEGFVP
jgi:hypothetical protein